MSVGTLPPRCEQSRASRASPSRRRTSRTLRISVPERWRVLGTFTARWRSSTQSGEEFCAARRPERSCLCGQSRVHLREDAQIRSLNATAKPRSVHVDDDIGELCAVFLALRSQSVEERFELKDQ